MATHLAHRLPWVSLCEVVDHMNKNNPGNHNPLDEEKHTKIVHHFARCLTDAIKEFAATDKSTDEEKWMFDIAKWDEWDHNGHHPTGMGAWMGDYPSILNGYLQLNLLLMDPEKYSSLIFSNGYCERRTTWMLEVLCGLCDGGHPDFLADHIKQAFDEHYCLKPLTADVLQILRDHCAMLFRCLYSTKEGNLALDAEFVANDLGLRFRYRRC
jgi:hypothetical protein|uniref:Uncharacterized protein n=1 Tax=Globisporangium ultimum (strain ATCC 200006 / CBS 805.95 / DAOM BR144) TaxID=431595 RepID=K3WRI2_GLOUD